MSGWRYRWRQFRWALEARIRKEDQALVARFLPPEAQALFWRMPRSDQRHSLAVLRTLLEWGETHPALLQAALLHDVGKAAAPLSPWERALLVLTEALCPRS
jgi:predicted HD phosphohydrolase